ncbi:MAG: F0F1 ATP synthase subunit epsilon [Pseudomonadota bacterium]
MSNTFKFELISPEKLLISEQVDHVVVPGEGGNFGVLAGHAPLIAMLRAGVLQIMDANATTKKQIYVRGGFAEAGPDGLTVLAQQAVFVDELKASRLREEISLVETELQELEEGSTAHLSAKQAFDQLKLLETVTA